MYEKYKERGGHPVFHPKEPTRFTDLFTDIYKLASSSDHIRDMRINEKLSVLLTLLMEQSWHPESVRVSRKRMELSSIKAFLDENYTEKILLDDLAEKFFINKFYMSKIFKETYGATINNYVIERRITRAKQFDAPEYSGDVDALGVLRILEAVRVCGLIKTCKVYQASTSELYGKVEEVPQRETTPFHPYSPYAVAKQYGFWMVKEYREAYGMFAVNGILFNHESERRGENFVTRKITLAAGRIAEGMQDHLELGNMDSLRDWGYAKDYVECMWLIMQQDKPEDFVIATGVQHTVRDFTEKAFAANGIAIRWEGSGIDEKGYDVATGKMLVCVNPQWFRPTDVDNLWGDPTKAKTVLGWNPQSTTYEQLVEIMAKHDRERAKREKAMKAVL